MVARCAVALILMSMIGAACHGADWALPSVTAAVAQADVVVVATVVVRGAAAGGGGDATERWDVRVDESLKGEAKGMIVVTGVAVGDAKGITSPFPVIAEPLAGRQVILFLKQARTGYTAQSRYVVGKERIEFLGDAEGRVWALGAFRRAVAELTLLQAALAAAQTPEGMAEVGLVALASAEEEVVWWGGTELLKRPIPARFQPTIQAALERVGATGKAGRVLGVCLAKVSPAKP